MQRFARAQFLWKPLLSQCLSKNCIYKAVNYYGTTNAENDIILEDETEFIEKLENEEGLSPLKQEISMEEFPTLLKNKLQQEISQALNSKSEVYKEEEFYEMNKDKHIFMYEGRKIPGALYGIEPIQEELKHTAADKLFHVSTVEMTHSVAKEEELPDVSFHMPEVAFAGRSNVGKSSLINSILNDKVAVVSSTPGSTKRFHFYDVGSVLYLVDFPGYGFAEGNAEKIDQWKAFMEKYVATRRTLRRVFVLIDAKVGILKADRRFLKFLNDNSISHQIVLTKCDKVEHRQLIDRIKSIYQEIRQDYFYCFPYIIPTSFEKGVNIDELQGWIYAASGLHGNMRLAPEKMRLKKDQQTKHGMEIIKTEVQNLVDSAPQQKPKKEKKEQSKPIPKSLTKSSSLIVGLDDFKQKFKKK